MLKSTVNIYNNATKGDNFNNMECVDMRVDLQTGCLKVIFLNKFISDLAVSSLPVCMLPVSQMMLPGSVRRCPFHTHLSRLIRSPHLGSSDRKICRLYILRISQ